MSALTQGQYLGDWLKNEFGGPNYCREEVTILVIAALESGRVLGVESAFSKYAPYDNSNPAAAAGILLHSQEVADVKAVTSIVDASNTATATLPLPHGFVVGDIVKVAGGTVDTDLNGNYAVGTVPSPTTFTFTSASLTDATYTEGTLTITKISRNAVIVKRGPATVSKAGLGWGATDATGVTAGLADLALLGIIAREGV